VLSTAIEELPADYRAVVVLRDVEGFSNQEIAASLGLTVVNVKIRVHRARLFLRKRLEEHFSILGEFVSGPTIESVARRDKKLALERRISSGEKGPFGDDVVAAVCEEFKENEELPNTSNSDDWAKTAHTKGDPQGSALFATLR